MFGSVACGSADEGDEPNEDPSAAVDTGEDALSASLSIAYATPPAGLPRHPWSQPDSKGWFGEKGMCGPTSAANLLLLYKKIRSPEQAYEAGVHSLIGTLPGKQLSYFENEFPELGCDYIHADSTQFLRDSVSINRPVNIMIGMGGTTSHWVTVVGARFDKPSNEWKYTVMTWGRYGEIGESKLAPNWATGYAGHNPAIRCDARSPYKLAWFPKR